MPRVNLVEKTPGSTAANTTPAIPPMTQHTITTVFAITMARALAQAGADVALASRTLDACQRAAADLSAATGCTAKAFTVDVASAASVRSSYTARTSRARSLMTSSATFNPVG